MVTDKERIALIRGIIKRRYKHLALSVLGNSVFTSKELSELKREGADVSQDDSFLDTTYHHNYVNMPVDENSPVSVEDMAAQQSQTSILPQGETHEYTLDAQNQKVLDLLDKMGIDVVSRVTGVIHDNNLNYKFNALQNIDRNEIGDMLTKETSISKLKQLLRDTSGNADRDWGRIVSTEMSNSIGAASVDRIVGDNAGKSASDIIVYRIIKQDNITDATCRKFYGDIGEVPKLYRLSTLLGNGSNYGKKQSDWQAVASVPHPNSRTSQVIELRPGFGVHPGGNMYFIGSEKWQAFVDEHLVG